MSSSNSSARTQDHTLNQEEREEVDYKNKTNPEVKAHPDKPNRAIDAERGKEIRPKPQIDQSNSNSSGSNIHHESRIFTAGHLASDIDKIQPKQQTFNRTSKLKELVDTSDNVSNQGFNHKPSSGDMTMERRSYREEVYEEEPKHSEGLLEKAKHALEGVVSMVKPLSSTTEPDEYRDLNEKARLKAAQITDRIRNKKLEQGGATVLPSNSKFQQYVEDLNRRAEKMERDAMEASGEKSRQSESRLHDQAEKEKLELENINLMHLKDEEETTTNILASSPTTNTSEEDEVNVLKRLQEDARKWGVFTENDTNKNNENMLESEGSKNKLEEKLLDNLPSSEMKEQMHKPLLEEKHDNNNMDESKNLDSNLTTLKVKETLTTLKDQAKSILTTIDQLALEFKGEENDEKELNLMDKNLMRERREDMMEERKSSGKGRPESIDHKQVEVDVARLGEQTES